MISVVNTLVWNRVTIDMSAEVLLVVDLRVDVLTRVSMEAAFNAFTDVEIDVCAGVLTDIVLTAVVAAVVVALEITVPLSRGVKMLSNVVLGELIDLVVGVDMAAGVLTVLTRFKYGVPTFSDTCRRRMALGCWPVAALYCDRVLQALAQSPFVGD